MGAVTGWVLRTWIKWTVVLVVFVAVVWLVTGLGGWFWTAVALAVTGQCYLVRQLAREWSWQARGAWWWAR